MLQGNKEAPLRSQTAARERYTSFNAMQNAESS